MASYTIEIENIEITLLLNFSINKGMRIFVTTSCYCKVNKLQ